MRLRIRKIFVLVKYRNLGLFFVEAKLLCPVILATFPDCGANFLIARGIAPCLALDHGLK